MLITVGIYRPEWLRGEMNSYLRRSKDGKCCCLGFVALRLGATETEITGEFSPAGLMQHKGFDMVNLIKPINDGCDDTDTCGLLMDTNDHQEGRAGKLQVELKTEVDRERVLKREARKAGYRFIFTDRAWLVPVINKVDRVLHRIADLWDRQTYGV